MTMVLTAMLLTMSFASVVASVLFTWRQHGMQVAELAQRMRGSRPVRRKNPVVRTPTPRSPINRWTIPIRLPDARLVAC